MMDRFPEILKALLASKYAPHVRLAGPKQPRGATGDPNVYQGEGYSSMTHDLRRNRIYQAAIKQTVAGGKRRFLEVGCGADACLTRMVLAADRDATVVAIEGNLKAADAAQRLLSALADVDGRRVKVVTGMSTSRTPEVNAAFALEYDVFLQEVLGFIASREGVVSIVADLQSRVDASALVFLPGAAATFFTPTYISLDDIKHNFTGRDIFFAAQDHMLVSKVPLDSAAPFRVIDPSGGPSAPQCGCLELIDFSAPLTSDATQLVQCRMARFEVPAGGQPVTVNSLTVFIWAGFPSATPRRFTAPFGFPFGCSDLVTGLRSAWKDGVLAFSSAACKSEGDTTAENWPNLVLLLDRDIHLQPGDALEVDSFADLRDATCRYEWVLRVLPGGAASKAAISFKIQMDSRDIAYYPSTAFGFASK
jgi:hypothetical protein